MLEALYALRRADQSADAASDGILFPRRGIDLAHGVAATGRTDRGKAKSFRARAALRLNYPQNLRDDVARALHDDRITDAHVFARDLILVMQRGVLHHDAADGHRLKLGDRGQCPGAADLDLNVAQDRGRLLGGEFVGDGITRRARDEAQPLLKIEPVELIDDAVNI